MVALLLGMRTEQDERNGAMVVTVLSGQTVPVPAIRQAHRTALPSGTGVHCREKIGLGSDGPMAAMRSRNGVRPLLRGNLTEFCTGVSSEGWYPVVTAGGLVRRSFAHVRAGGRMERALHGDE